MRVAYAPLLAQSASNQPSGCGPLRGNVLVCTGGESARFVRALTLHAGRRLKAALDKAANSLSALRPPRDVAADNSAVVAGLRQMADLYGGLLMSNTENQQAVEKKAETIRHSPTENAFVAARADLQRKGYNLGFLTTDLASGSAVKRDTGGGSTGYGVAPNPKQVKALPFSLVSAAGVQPASGLSAYVHTCLSTDGGTTCSMACWRRFQRICPSSGRASACASPAPRAQSWRV